jgi:hypothetical protein
LFNKFGSKAANDEQKRLSIKAFNNLPKFMYTLPYDRNLALKNKIQEINHMEATFNFNFLLRPNAFYRSKIDTLIHSFRVNSSPHFNASASCVAAHVRRGDRIKNIANINMTQWCFNATRKTDAKQNLCLNEDKELKPCIEFGSIIDYGCYNVPFGSVTLKHVLKNVEKLVGPNKPNVVLFSDDMTWMKEEIKKLNENNNNTSKHWNVYYLPFQPTTMKKNKIKNEYEEYKYMRSEASTDSGVYFYASLKLAQQCVGLVAHFGSAVAVMFYGAMCSQHASMYGLCPPVYNFEWGL